MAEERDKEMELSAWLDGELDEDASREIEALLAADPDFAARAHAMKGTSTLMRREVDAAEARVDMSEFSARVMSSIAAGEASREPSRGEASREISFFGRMRSSLAEFFAAHRPALAAAATMLVILGGGSFYFLLSPQAEVEATGPVVVRGGSTVIEDLSFGDGSAVVYRTESDVTVIWVTED